MSGRTAQTIRFFLEASPDLVLLDIRTSTFQHLTVDWDFNVLEMAIQTLHFGVISHILKFQFAIKCGKVDFLMSNKSKSVETSRETNRMVRGVLPDTPKPPQFQPELLEKHFL